MKSYQAIILGSGPAGFTTAAILARHGKRVAIVERDLVGGICTNWGCTPSKAMIESAKVAQIVKNSAKYGINANHVSIDFAKVASRRNQVVATNRAQITALLKSYGIDIYQGEGEVQTGHELKVRSGNLDPDGKTMHYSGEEILLQAEHIVIATGSAPLIPGIIDETDPSIVNSNRLITIDHQPDQLTIIGGGVIGLEFATIFANLGTKVKIIEFFPRLLALMDDDISATITQSLQALGVEILTNYKVLAVEHGVIKAENQQDKTVVEIPSQNTLVAIGRKAVVHAAMYDKLGLKYSPKGIAVDDYLATSVPGIWSVGDATGKSILAHVGIQQGTICAHNILAATPADRKVMDYSVIPEVVYSMPEIVRIGQLPEDQTGIQSFKVPFSANLRASIEDNTTGFIKIWVKDEILIATQMIGYTVSEIAQEMANMIALKTPIRSVINIIHAHPSYAEIIKTVLELAIGEALQ